MKNTKIITRDILNKCPNVKFKDIGKLTNHYPIDKKKKDKILKKVPVFFKQKGFLKTSNQKITAPFGNYLVTSSNELTPIDGMAWQIWWLPFTNDIRHPSWMLTIAGCEFELIVDDWFLMGDHDKAPKQISIGF